MRTFVFFLLAFVAMPVSAQAPDVANRSVEEREAVLDSLVTRIDRRSEEVERRAATEEARRELDNEANARLQNYIGLVSALISVFALLTTVLLVIIAFRTPGQAIAAAVKAASDGLELERAKINQRVTETELLLGEATALVNRIRSHETAAKTIIDQLRPGEVPKSKQDIATIKAAAVEANSKPLSERTAEDYRAVIVDHLSRSRWKELIDDAHAMAYLYKDSPRERSFALLHEGFALDELGEYQKACDIYETIIEEYGSRSDMDDEVANALVNQGKALGAQGKMDKAYSVFQDVIENYGSADDPAVQQSVALALVNQAVVLLKNDDYSSSLEKCEDARNFISQHPNVDFSQMESAVFDAVGVSLLKQGNLPEALDQFDASLDKFGQSSERSVSANVTSSTYNKACGLALNGKADAAVATLEQWAARVGRVDCARIAEDKDFDPVRGEDVFKRFLHKHGCS